MSKKATSPRPMKSDPIASHRRAVWMPAVLLVLLLACIAVVGAYLKAQDQPAAAATDAPAERAIPAAAVQPPAVAAAVSIGKIIGRWRRPDGGYELMIRQISADGILSAAYFNPRPINVAKATAKREADKISVFVELNDRGYPGNYYTLTYEPGSDQLQGVYHHLGIGQDFAVEFARMTP